MKAAFDRLRPGKDESSRGWRRLHTDRFAGWVRPAHFPLPCCFASAISGPARAEYLRWSRYEENTAQRPANRGPNGTGGGGGRRHGDVETPATAGKLRHGDTETRRHGDTERAMTDDEGRVANE